MATTFVINADSTPVVGSPLNPFSDLWSCVDWMTWFTLRAQKYGKQQAQSDFMNAWNSQSSWAYDYSWCKYNTQFAQFARDNNLDILDIFSQAYVGAGAVATSAIDTAQNAASSAANTTKVLSYAIPIATIFLIALILYIVAKRYNAI